MYVLSLQKKPTYNRTEAYLDQCLLKGKVCSEELTLSPPNGCSYFSEVEQKDAPLTSLCCDAENQYFQQELPGKSTKSSAMKLVDPKHGMDFSRHLLYSCVHGKSQGIQLILAKESNVDINQPLPCDNGLHITPLGLASLSASPSACDILIKSGADVNKAEDGTGLSPLHLAALANSPGAIETLIVNGGRPEQTDSQGLIPLHFACYKGLPKVATALLKHSPSVHDTSKSPDGVTPLIMTILGGHIDVLKMLVKRGGPGCLASPDQQGLTPIHYAAWSCNLKAMKILASLSTWKEGLKQKDMWGRTPLIIAASRGDPALCQFLLKKGAKWNETDSEGRSVLHWAVLSGQLPCVNFFMNSGNDAQLCGWQDHNGVSPSHLAATKKNADILAVLLDKETGQVMDNPEAVKCGRSPLVWAATCGWLEGITLLLQADRMSGGTGMQDTMAPFNALHAAASVGSVNICQALIAAGYNVECSSNEVMTPLHYSCRHGHVGATKELLYHGAKVDTLTTNNKSGLHLAVMHGHTDVVHVLLEAGANATRPLGPSATRPLGPSATRPLGPSATRPLGPDQDCPTHLACIYGHSQVLEVLLSVGVDPNQPRKGDGHTPIFIAAANGHLDCCKVLIQHNTDVTTRMRSMPEGLTPLDVAMKNGHSECANYLIRCHAPSGGGVYHRAALTIQAVWRYHRHKTCQRVSREWAVMILQRSIKTWLRRLRSRRVREARHAAYNRAALCIQHKWKTYIAEKRRYEDTYNRLKLRLQQERLAASLIVAELQAQTHKVSLPPSSHSLSGAANVLMAGRILHDRIQSGKQVRPSLTTNPSKRMLVSQPHRPLKGALPAIKLKNKKSLYAESSRNLGNLQINDTSKDVFQSRQVVSLPPLLDDKKVVAKTSDRETPNLKNSQTRTAFSKHKPKLPPIVDTQGEIEVSSLREAEMEVQESLEVAKPATSISYDNESKLVSAMATSALTVCPDSVTTLSLSHLRRLRHTSTFKDTPLCYQPFASKKIPPKHATLNAPKTPENELKNSNDNPLLEDCRLPSREADGDNSSNNLPVSKETPDSLLKSDEEMNKVVNKIERYEKLMKVLTLLKQAKELEENELDGGTHEEAGPGLDTIKEHIKAALDEAIKLRVETDTICRQTT